MPISQAVADFAAALDAANAELREVNSRISALETKRQTVERAPPHTDDIVAVFTRGLRDAERDFEAQFASHLKTNFTGSDGKAAKAAAPNRSADILRLEADDLKAQERTDRAIRGTVPDLNGTVLAYLLRDQIGAIITTQIEKLCPYAAKGMKAADRERELREIDAQLAVLKDKARSLLSEINEARKVVRR